MSCSNRVALLVASPPAADILAILPWIGVVSFSRRSVDRKWRTTIIGTAAASAQGVVVVGSYQALTSHFGWIVDGGGAAVEEGGAQRIAGVEESGAWGGRWWRKGVAKACAGLSISYLDIDRHEKA
ncbi:hypothetical protein FNV43_RR13329 [Rhamnella rubrinervis]|uniref:Uncharacterized protein n=1 Tax=Rhamnella rubrinervis TaxID=2594499 RepID=A0A8K0H0W0_9ROSA|nr:hypothetical protein FNV43_RR13329 [Rhamnella rubrinervis]